ncbi:hypothetical protein V8G54_013563 [Vigna mungo]|uniref:Transposase-associated domain-containing protein n=1 Tax=Vigna mungo TaxID=3915 RepID=A0AAQ3NWB9_VIGMU
MSIRTTPGFLVNLTRPSLACPGSNPGQLSRHSTQSKLNNQRHISEKYEGGVSEFLEYVKEHAKPVNETYFCPCVHCLNKVCEDLNNIRDHLFIYGMMRSYNLDLTWGSII